MEGDLSGEADGAAMIDYEFYETPQTFTRWLFRDLAERNIPITGTLFEPCVGSGAIVQAAEAWKLDWRTNDLDARWDADTMLDATQNAPWIHGQDWTVSNPPFTPAVEIIGQALTYSRIGVAMHLRASIHEPLKTGSRRSWLRRLKPSGILWLPRFAYQRSKTTGKWTTDSVCACWVIWLKSDSRQFIDYPPEWVFADLEAETPVYRARMDAIMKGRAA